jgi:hypothetical protein
MSGANSLGGVASTIAKFIAEIPLDSMTIEPAQTVFKGLRDYEVDLVRRCG